MLPLRPFRFALVCALPGCVLFDLAGFDLPHCTANRQCESLNTAHGIPAAACQRYQCAAQERTCALLPRDDDEDGDPSLACGGRDCDDRDPRRAGNPLNPRAREVCDGLDNNCNGIVDDGAAGRATQVTLGAASATAEPMRAAPTATGRLGVSVGSGDRTGPRFFLSDGASAMSDSTLRYRTQSASNTQPFTTLTWATDACFPDPSQCGFFDAAAAEPSPSAARWLLAAVNLTGCAAGQLRVSAFQPGQPDADQLGPALRSTLAAGVGTSTFPVYPTGGAPTLGACTGDNRMRTPAGAARPTLVGLGAQDVPRMGTGPAFPQALLAYRGRPAASDACAAPDAPVEAVGVWLESGGSVPDLQWVNGSGSGRPDALGTARGDAPVAVLPWTSPPGFLVAFPTPQQAIALRFVAAVDTSTVQPLSGIRAGDGDQHPDTVRPTPPLVVTDLGQVQRPGALAVDRVALSAGPAAASSDGLFRLGLAWQEGCGAGARRVYFGRVDCDPARASSAVLVDSAQVGADAAERPSLAYVTEGFVAAGFARDGRTAAAGTLGGWVVGYTEGARLMAQRVSALDGRPLDAEPLVVSDGSAGEAWRAFVVSRGPATQRAPLLWAGQSPRAVVGGTLFCAPPAM